MVGPCTIESPLRTLEKMEDVFQAWWNAWYNEKLADFVAKPPKFYRSGPAIQVGDIVVFQKRPEEQKLGTPIWSVGRVIQTVPATIDDLIREVVVEYKNASEKVFRMTRGAARFVQRGGPGSDAEAQRSLERGYESALDENASHGPRTDGSRWLVSIRHEPRMAQGLLSASRRPKHRLLHREHPRRPLG
jgi:hypothetical protein